ncbi:YceK/YidQ family lipoprotein [Pseudomonas gingeri]
MTSTRHALLAATLGLSLSGCGTINTVFRGDDVTRRNLKEWNTHCAAVPRVYSGVFYNLCVLHGPSQVEEQAPDAPALTPFQFVDLIPSGILDTLALPYTLYRQSRDGSIDLP